MESRSLLFLIEVNNYFLVLVVFLERFRFKGELKFCFSSIDEWTSRAYYPDLEDMMRSCVIHLKGN